MKKMSYFMLALMLMVQSAACSAREKVIEVSDLPQAAQTLLKEFFGGKDVSLVQKDTEGLRASYDVVLADGTKLEFDSKGEWTEIDSKPQEVPAALVPQAIGNHVKSKFASAKIVQIERDKRGYEIDLSNGIEVRFNRDFKVVGMDD